MNAAEHIAEIRSTGITVVPDIINEGDIARLKEKVQAYRKEEYPDDIPFDGDLRFQTGLLFSDELARAVTHPLALEILRGFLETDDIHFCHQPVVTILKPAKKLKGKFPEKGWHSDYPYHPGVFPNEEWPERPLAVQFNICIDPFAAETAGTQYVPGSHLRGQRPPASFNEGGTKMGEGEYKDVVQIEAPAGAAVLYDARTWHRACHELNVSGHDRIALLNAVSPAWIRPMMDKTWLLDKFEATPVAQALDARTREEIRKMCLRDTAPTPPDMPKLQERQAIRNPPKKVS